MKISKTPLRISLFGGGTDFPEFFKSEESLIIGGTIDKYVYTTVNKQIINLSKKNIKIFYRKVERVDKVSEIKHKVVQSLLKKFKIKKNIEIHIASDLPSFSGLGSSSAFSVGMYNLLQMFTGKLFSKKNLAAKTINLERNILKETVGFQDQIHCSYGGFNLIKLNKIGFTVKNYFGNKMISKLEKNLFLIFTGITRKAENIEKKKLKRIKLNFDFLKRINLISKKALRVLKSNKFENLDQIGKLLNETWELKKKLSNSVSNKSIDSIYNHGIKNGALGGKLLGAGSGGFLLFYVNNKNKKRFKKAMKNYSQIEFKFTNNGSQVVDL